MKNQKNTTIPKIIDSILLIILIITVIIAWSDGYFIHKEITIIEVCNGATTEYILPPEVQKALQEDMPWNQPTINQTNLNSTG